MKEDSLGGCLKVTWPLMLSMAANAVMMFADRLFLSRYSETSIQAALPAGMIAFTAIAFLQSIVAYSGTFVAQYAGSGARAACARAFGQGVWLSIFCIPVLLALIPVGFWLFNISGHAPAVLAEEKVYYLTLMVGNLTTPFVAALSGFFTGRGFTRLVMVASIIGNLLNIVIDPFLIWGLAGCPEWGIAGAGVATALSQGCMLIILLIAIARERHFASSYRLRVALGIQPQMISRIFSFGLPSGGHTVLDLITFTAFVFLTGRLDALSFAASNIAFSLYHLIFAPLLGMGMGAMILVGQFQGRKESDAASRSVWYCSTLGWIYLAIISVLMLATAPWLFAIFYPAKASFTFADFSSVSWKLMIIFLIWAWFDTINIIFAGALKGAGDTKFVMLFTTITGALIWIPIVFVLYILDFGITTLWLTLLLVVLLNSGGFTWRLLRGRWRSIQVIEN